MTSSAPFAVLIVMGACVQAPANPSFQVDVAPILAARCVRCHGFPSIGGAPPKFRLDGYPDTETVTGDLFPGAGTYARLVATRVCARTMPPRFPLDDVQIDVLDNWAASTVVGPAARGEARAGNLPPRFVFDSRTKAYELHDPDGDLVVGTLRATGVNGNPVVITNVHSGRDTVAFDPGRFAAGTYRITADLDDGGEMFAITVGQVEIP